MLVRLQPNVVLMIQERIFMAMINTNYVRVREAAGVSGFVMPFRSAPTDR
jgi:hypothetical protein